MKDLERDFLSCDWGTTSFRLRWVSGPERKILRELRKSVGIKALYEEALQLGPTSSTNRDSVFAEFLRGRIEEMIDASQVPGRPLPLVISGMASSTIGWMEVPYAGVPFPLDGSGLRAQELFWEAPDFVGQTHLISGIATEHDMMRGEESEVLGLMSLPELVQHREQSLLILPGTHSKHITIDKNCIVDIRTFMTGELFDVLGRQSLLRASVDLDASSDGAELAGANRAAFAEGSRCGREHGLAGGLFRVRTRAVLGQRPLAENKWFFSGLLIGAELKMVIENASDRPVILAGSRVHSDFYQLALETIGETITWVRLPAEQVERATVTTHALFLFGKGWIR
jgi:2-dehydro-3-deoxygalactonokinase